MRYVHCKHVNDIHLDYFYPGYYHHLGQLGKRCSPPHGDADNDELKRHRSTSYQAQQAPIVFDFISRGYETGTTAQPEKCLQVRILLFILLVAAIQILLVAPIQMMAMTCFHQLVHPCWISRSP